MQAWITSVINQSGYIGSALLIALENLFSPSPSELIPTFGGFMAARRLVVRRILRRKAPKKG